MNLHSIIEAATPGPWRTVWSPHAGREYIATEGLSSIGHADSTAARHIATFDPTLTAAMLAVCEAAGDSEAWTFAEGRPMRSALCALESLLTERGLTMGGDE